MTNKDYEKLLNEFMPLAENMLDEHGAFLPYGGILYEDGDVQYITIPPEGEAGEKTGIFLHQLQMALNKMMQQDNIRASVLFMDVRIQPPGADEKVDCIMARFEHSGEKAVDTFRPYAILPTGEVHFSTVFGTDRQSEFEV